MKTRNESLDALRGFAILTMVLSGTIAFGDVLPAWMFHAQVPPPAHKFNPDIAGITWVDLVFPFFLFSMGAAIPLSLKKHLEEGKGAFFVISIAVKRFLLLAWFAFFTHHMKAWAISPSPATHEHLLSILGFVLLFFQFYDIRNSHRRMFFLVLKIISFIAGIYLLRMLPFWNGNGFDFYKSDIIILVLANMALFGTLVYFFTVKMPLLRIGLLPFIMAFFFAASEPADGFAKEVFNFNVIAGYKIDWLYKFYFLKYLFIIIPGTIAGEWMMNSSGSTYQRPVKPVRFGVVAMISTALIVLNLYGLFTRHLLWNFIISVIFCTVLDFVLKDISRKSLLRQLTTAGTYLLLLGLLFESFQGGIKKDPSTYSYYFVTGGLAFFWLAAFMSIAQSKSFSSALSILIISGKNPMVAYVAGNLLLIPLLQLTHIKQYWDAMNQNAFMGFAKGVVFTAAVSLLTIYFVRRKWFWKT